MAFEFGIDNKSHVIEIDSSLIANVSGNCRYLCEFKFYFLYFVIFGWK